MVFDGIVGSTLFSYLPSFHPLSYLGPSVSQLFMSGKDNLIFLGSPKTFANLGVKVIMPSRKLKKFYTFTGTASQIVWRYHTQFP